MSDSISQELVARARDLLRQRDLEAISFEACRKHGKPISNGSARYAMPGGKRDLLFALYLEIGKELERVALRAVGPHRSQFEAAAEALARALAGYARRHSREVRCFMELRRRLDADGHEKQRSEVERALSDWATPFRKAESIDPQLDRGLVPALILLSLTVGLEMGEEEADGVASQLSRRLLHGSATQAPNRKRTAPKPKRVDLFD